MKILNNINAAQNLPKEIASNSLTGNKNNAANKSFEETLDKAIKDTSPALPASADTGLDVGLGLLNKEGMLAGNALQDEIGNIFGELGLGIASSFLAALAGEDSATAVAETPEMADEATDETTPGTTAKAQASAEGAGADAANSNRSAAPIPQNRPLPVADAPASTVPKDSKTSAIATAAVTGLQDVLLDDDNENNKTSVS